MNDENEFVREPDEPIVERLQEYSTNPDSELEHILQLSRLEYEKYEKSQIEILEQEYAVACIERELECMNIRVQLEKLSRYDKEIEEVNLLIKDIFDLYASGAIKNYQLDENTYNRLFAIFKNIRLSDIDRNFLNTLFIKM
jgi:hypothetical protein